jgi:hypothetical protein
VHKDTPEQMALGTQVPLCHTDNSTGGGTFVCSGRIDVNLNRNRVDHLTLTLTAAAS